MTGRGHGPKLRRRRIEWAGKARLVRRQKPIAAWRHAAAQAAGDDELAVAPAWSPWLQIPIEFSRPLLLDAVPPQGVAVQLQATPEECRALAIRFSLVELASLNGEIRVERVDTTASYLVTGRLAADAVQTCVVSLEPVPAKVEAEFDRLFSRDLPAETEGEVEIDAEAETPEPLLGDRLDLGEILAEELSLALDPYPRAPDADRHLAEFGGEPGGGTRSPFGALAGLRRD